jgi:hypothetical protein
MYSDFKYLYPPRPEGKIRPSSIATYDNGNYLAQIKANGSCAVVYIASPDQSVIYNRHNQLLTKHGSLPNFGRLHSGNGYMILVGEYMNKSKRDENGKNFNDNFLIFDILMYDGQFLTCRYTDRQKLLQLLYPAIDYNHFLDATGVDRVFRMRNFTDSFSLHYNALSQIDYVEGLVIKRKDSILKPCTSASANSDWQIKVRKETKNYAF